MALSKKGDAGSGGIQLTFDESGEPRVAQPTENTTECFGGVRCRYCEIEQDEGGTPSMHCASPGANSCDIASLKKCPLGKWEPIVWHNQDKLKIAVGLDVGWDACCSCGTSTMWQLKTKAPQKKAKTKKPAKVPKPHWVCIACHPPAPGIEKENIEIRQRGDLLKKP